MVGAAPRAYNQGMESENGPFGIAFGALAVLGAAAALVGVRDQVSNTPVALVLVVFVLLAGVAGGRAAGVTTALVAALSFDFFHTTPYNSLKIDNRTDLETALILLVIGILVGEIGAWTRRSRLALEEDRRELRRIHRVAELAAHGEGVHDLTSAVAAELSAGLRLRACHFEPAPYGPPLAALSRRGVLDSGPHWHGDGFELPPEGVELTVLGRGVPMGRFVLEPTPGVGVSRDRRIAAVALADQLGSVLANQS